MKKNIQRSDLAVSIEILLVVKEKLNLNLKRLGKIIGKPTISMRDYVKKILQKETSIKT